LDGCAVVSMAGIELSHGHSMRSARAPTSLSHEWMMQLMFTILHDAICTTRADRYRPTSTAIPRSPRRRDGTIPTIPVSITSSCGRRECWRDRGESTTGKHFQPTTTSRRRSTLSPTKLPRDNPRTSSATWERRAWGPSSSAAGRERLRTNYYCQDINRRR
jgi:hypothetical protein